MYFLTCLQDLSRPENGQKDIVTWRITVTVTVAVTDTVTVTVTVTVKVTVMVTVAHSRGKSYHDLKSDHVVSI